MAVHPDGTTITSAPIAGQPNGDVYRCRRHGLPNHDKWRHDDRVAGPVRRSAIYDAVGATLTTVGFATKSQLNLDGLVFDIDDSSSRRPSGPAAARLPRQRQLDGASAERRGVAHDHRRPARVVQAPGRRPSTTAWISWLPTQSEVLDALGIGPSSAMTGVGSSGGSSPPAIPSRWAVSTDTRRRSGRLWRRRNQRERRPTSRYSPRAPRTCNAVPRGPVRATLKNAGAGSADRGTQLVSGDVQRRHRVEDGMPARRHSDDAGGATATPLWAVSRPGKRRLRRRRLPLRRARRCRPLGSEKAPRELADAIIARAAD